MKLKTHTKTILADTKTPTGIFMALRDYYQQPLLLESSDYNNKQDHYSYLCFNPIATFELFNQNLKITVNSKSTNTAFPPSNKTIIKELMNFKEQFIFDELEFKFCTGGIFGYSSFNAVEYFEDINLKQKDNNQQIPEIIYHLYSLILVFNHTTNNLHLISHAFNEEIARAQLEDLDEKIKTEQITEFNFNAIGKESSNLTDQDFIELANKGKDHCQKGDVFQIVLSRQFSQSYIGDDFNLYRALKNINPSPYLFYFDTGKFRLIGSSPEAQLIIKNNKAQINPIAGTYKRTGNDLEDIANAKKLVEDKKENAEHMMLVDLARNDLSKYCSNVAPKYIKQIQLYSHVIHLVSKIEGELKPNVQLYDVLANSSPAGTLSGAPKYRALELINKYEPTSRGYYGGSIGFISNKNELNHAIMIRTFLSKDNVLYYQAGAGIVNASNPESENLEIYNKISALKKAIKEARKINKSIPSYSHETISA
ncbi:MAG: anthranilate synthase component I family protein [Bacteroidota bacterium]|nr:anthranilate synthase component I family protein [Bacteroidota bacterium]MDP3146313.1 anthranilate synthase component I family protein [Bacteroidota bacterium]MDP3556616.1 anthranilate synthase component I family protein [Bacteroidota bacterium]